MLDPLSNDLTLWSALVGMGLPWVAAFIQSDNLSSKVNSVIFAVAGAIAALVTELVRNGTDFTAQGYFHSFIVVTLAAIALYKLYWKPSGHIDAARKFGSSRS